MALEFKEVYFDNIGRETSSTDAMWGKLELRFTDTDTNRIYGVVLETVLPKGPKVTIAELQIAARDRAKTILRAALDCLEANDIAGLENIQRQQRKF